MPSSRPDKGKVGFDFFLFIWPISASLSLDVTKRLIENDEKPLNKIAIVEVYIVDFVKNMISSLLLTIFKLKLEP